jgi:carboxyl-terminal processing protease
MPWDSIASAMYEKLDRIQPHLDELRRRTEARQSEDREFAYVREDVVRYRDLLTDKSVSLNEAQRIKEKEELEAKQKARKEERKSRGEAPVTTYEITLKNADLPGLPDPVSPTNQVALAEADAPPPSDAAADEGEEDDKSPAVDVHLDETKRILVDLIALLANNPGAATVTARK